MVKEITKKVYCYKINNNGNLSGLLNEYKDKLGDDWKFLNKDYLYTKDGFKFFMEILEINNYSTENDGIYKVYSIILYKLKETDFPYIFNFTKGKKSKINIAKDESILEQTHAIIIPKQNLMLMEDNYIGAKVSHIPQIIIAALGVGSIKDLEIEHITNHKVIEKFKKGKGIKSYTFRAGQQGMKALSSIVPVGILEQTESLYAREKDLIFEVTIKHKKRGHAINDGENLKNKIMNLVKLSKNGEGQSVDDISMFNVKLIDEKFPLKMFDDYLLQDITVNKLDEKYKYLDTKEMFENLIKLYNSPEFKLDKKHEITFVENKFKSNLIGLVSDLNKTVKNEPKNKEKEIISNEVAIE